MSDQANLFFWNNQNLFSTNYLEHRLPESDLWKAQKEKAAIVFEQISRAYESIKSLKLGPGEEAELENKFIQPVLTALGYAYHVQPRAQRGMKKRVPDYALFKDEEAYKAARKVKDGPDKFFSQSLTILEAKYWGRRLNDTDKKDVLDSRDPTAQTVKYLDSVNYHTSGKINWAILTNGKLWRLFYFRASSRSGNYFEVDLEEIILRADRDAFLYFHLFFSRDAFLSDPVSGKSWLDQHLRGSEDYAVRISTKLKERIFDQVFEGLASGFIHFRKTELGITEETDDTRKEIFRGCLTLLYRLLFILYAESRNLLPVNEDGYYKVSLYGIKKDIYEDLKATGQGKMSRRSCIFWARLQSLFDIIAKGDPALNIPIYNGGLFETRGDSFLAKHKMPDFFLSDAVEQLTVDHDGDYKPGMVPFIDYSSLNVRHLGDIYEGLLEFHIRIAENETVEVREKGKSLWKNVAEVKAGTKTYRRKQKGEVYIENIKHERRAFGSYYTPHYIVEYIVKNTVGPVLQDKLKTAAELLAELAETNKALHKQKDTTGIHGYRAKLFDLESSLFYTLFDVKVLDPAMGSGHFLVHTVDYLSDGIIAFLAGFPENPVLKTIDEMKAAILAEVERQGVRIDENRLTEVNLIKRMVMKRCIYGVDLNEMAVELAKLSLWLDSFTLGAPLSFLDHHLKCGNSLVGTNIDELEKALSGHLFAVNLEPLKRAIRDMIFVSDLPDATFTQVKESYEKFREANNGLEGYRVLLDMLVAEYFGVADSKKLLVSDFDRIDLGKLRESIESLPPKDSKAIEAVEAISQEKRVFHWEIEFPEVFYERTGEFDQKIEKKKNPGFDCVIGNPPYVRIQKMDDVSAKAYLKTYETTHKNYDIYVPFVERGVSMLNANGYFCYIMPNKFLHVEYGEKLRGYLSSGGHVRRILNFGHNQIFSEEATTYTCLLFLAAQYQISFHYTEILPLEKKDEMDVVMLGRSLNSKVISGFYVTDQYGSSPWIFAVGNEAELLDKIRKASTSLSEIVEQIIVGLQTSADSVYMLEKKMESSNGTVMCYSAALDQQIKFEGKLLKPVISGVNIDRYECLEPDKTLIFPYKAESTGTVLIKEMEFEQLYPLTWQYLKQNELTLRDRENKKFDDLLWYRFGRHQNLDKQEYSKIAVPRLIDRLKAFYDKKGDFYLDNVDVNGILLKTGGDYKPEYLLSLLNSRLMDFLFKKGSVKFRGEYYSANKQFIAPLPIEKIAFNTPERERKERVSEAIKLYHSEMEALS